jgi:ABC-type uncharacterized transport system fused permease/ATPase subunit
MTHDDSSFRLDLFVVLDLSFAIDAFCVALLVGSHPLLLLRYITTACDLYVLLETGQRVQIEEEMMTPPRRRIRMPPRLSTFSYTTTTTTALLMLLLFLLRTSADGFLLTSAPTSTTTAAPQRNHVVASSAATATLSFGGDRPLHGRGSAAAAGGGGGGGGSSSSALRRNIPGRSRWQHDHGRAGGLLLRAQPNNEESDKNENDDITTTIHLAVNEKKNATADSATSSSCSSLNNNNNNKNSNNKNNNNLDWKAIRQQAVLFQQMALPYYQESKTGRWLLVALLCLTLVNSGVSVIFSYLGKDFWNALSDKNVEEFYHVLSRYCAALLLGAPVVTLYTFQREQLAVHWREWMTARTFQLYTSNRVYYNLQRSFSSSASSSGSSDSSSDSDEYINTDDNDDAINVSKSTTSSSISSNSIDNPDQRISEDVNSFTSYSLQLVITVLTSLIDLVAFSTILWGIYPQLFLAIIAYALFGTITTTFLGRSLVPLNFAQLQKEADLRYSLVRLRDNAESIAFYAGEDLEGQAVERRLENVMDNKRQIIVQQRNLELFTNSYRYLVQILPVAVVAPQYFAGSIALGVISQSVGAFNHILNDLSIIVNQFERLSSFSAGIARLSSFYQAMQTVNANALPVIAPAARKDGDDGAITMNQPIVPSLLQLVDTNTVNVSYQHAAANATINGIATAAAAIGYGIIQLQKFPSFEETITTNEKHNDINSNLVLEIDHLDLVTPDFQQRLLIQDLNIKLYKGQHLLIVGNSGAGKSSLLRAVAGLWTVGNGRIARPYDDDVYFLPQRPYCTLGSLKDQLLYPSIEREHEQPDDYDDEQHGDSSPSSSSGRSRRDKKEGAAASNGQKIVPRAHWLKQTISDDDLLRVLEQVDLLDLAKRVSNNKNAPGDNGLNTVLDWSNVLSLGEQQRLAFARVLVNRPRLVILDEATSALDLVAEARMYGLLQKLSSSNAENDDDDESSLSPLQRRIPGLTYISVGHRPSLLKYHDKRLRLKGTAGFELEDIEKSASTSSSQPSSTTLSSSSFGDDFSSSTMMDQQVTNL